MYVVRDARSTRAMSSAAAHRESRRRDRVGASVERLNRASGDAEKIAEIESYVEKYLGVLGAADLRRPKIVLRGNLGARWLAKDVWSTADPTTTTMEVQRRILGHSLTLERVIAHEVIHHVDSVRRGTEQMALARYGLYDAHGRSFRELAAVINAETCPGFVTEKSDQEHVTDAVCKTYLVVIVPFGKRLGYAWTARLSKEGAAYLQEKIDKNGARATYSTDPGWAERGAKFRRLGSYSVPDSEEDQAKLRALYDSVEKRVLARTG